MRVETFFKVIFKHCGILFWFLRTSLTHQINRIITPTLWSCLSTWGFGKGQSISLEGSNLKQNMGMVLTVTLEDWRLQSNPTERTDWMKFRSQRLTARGCYLLGVSLHIGRFSRLLLYSQSRGVLGLEQREFCRSQKKIPTRARSNEASSPYTVSSQLIAKQSRKRK